MAHDRDPSALLDAPHKLFAPSGNDQIDELFQRQQRRHLGTRLDNLDMGVRKRRLPQPHRYRIRKELCRPTRFLAAFQDGRIALECKKKNQKEISPHIIFLTKVTKACLT